MINNDKWIKSKLINDMANAHIVEQEIIRFPLLGSSVLVKKIALPHQRLKKLWKMGL